MGLETGDFIANLNNLWPLEDDPTHEGNEHLQLIKNVLQQSFKGNDGAGNPENGWDSGTGVNPEELDHMIGVTWPVKDTQDLIKNVSGTIAVGQDDDTLPMKLHTSGVNGAVQQWDDGGSQVATVMNAINVVDHIYPVGTYIDRDGSAPDPNVQYPGTTWAPVVGMMLIGDGTWDSGGPDEITLTVDATGGEASHQLTEDELAKHSHESGSYYKTLSDSNNNGSVRQVSGYSDTTGYPTEAVGGNARHNNLPPYTVTKKWKRTA